MRHPDITILTAAPPNEVSKCTVQVVGGPVGISTYFYWIVAHYPIGSVISLPFQVVGAPSPTTAQNYVIISWEPTGATSYDLLRTLDSRQPADGSNAALALALTATIFRDQGQALSPYSLSGLTHGAPTDGWAHMNNRDYTEPVLELFPAVHLLKIIFPDGSSQSTAGGGGSQGPPGPPGPQGPIGATGSTGPAGGQGPTGATGSPGSTGAQGPPGVQGATGSQGVPGPQGPAGTGVTIKGSVPTEADLPTTGNQPGDAWITSDTGHLWVWGGSSWTDAGVIQGPPGATGPQGPIGLTGAEGATGATGAAGTPGATGATGSPGATGPTGNQGPQGIQGAQGIPGPVIPATTTVLGGVKIGANITILSDGLISVAGQTPWLSNIAAANFNLNNVGAIGIGTTSPLSGLAITGSLSGAVLPLITLINSASNANNQTVRLRLGPHSGFVANPALSPYIESYTNNNSFAGLAFGTYSGTVAERVRIDEKGNVGIGTTIVPIQNSNIPVGRTFLTVKGSTEAACVELTQGGPDTEGQPVGVIIWTDRNNSSANNTVGSISVITSGTTAGNRGTSMFLYTRGDNAAGINLGLAIDQFGNVSIGRSEPVPGGTPPTPGRTFLTVKGSTDAACVELTQGAPDADGQPIGLILWADINNFSASNLCAAISVNTAGATANNRGTQMFFYTRANNSAGIALAMIIDQNGNVGINKTIPGSRLAVVGLPTSPTGLTAGDVWNNGGVLNIV